MKKWIIGICLGLVLLVVVGVYSVFASVNAAMDSYAIWDAALAVIHHMETHDGAWPTDWRQLEDSFATTPRLMGPGWDNLRERVEIDWSSDPRELAKTVLRDDQPPFKAIWLKSGSEVYWLGAEPNTLIHAYLNEEHDAQEASRD